MLVICNSISGKSLPDDARIMGETDETLFEPLKTGMEYKVYGIMFYTTRIDFLLCPEGENPLWVPSNIFNVLDDKLPPDWGFIITEKTIDYSDLYDAFGIISILGYFELIRSYQHYIGILERDAGELQKFHSYRLSCQVVPAHVHRGFYYGQHAKRPSV